MKMYVFNPNDWGMIFFVMAENKIEAYKSLMNHFQKETETYNRHSAIENLELWKKVNPLDSKTFPNKYTLNEYEKGVVVESELA